MCRFALFSAPGFGSALPSSLFRLQGFFFGSCLVFLSAFSSCVPLLFVDFSTQRAWLLHISVSASDIFDLCEASQPYIVSFDLLTKPRFPPTPSPILFLLSEHMRLLSVHWQSVCLSQFWRGPCAHDAM